MWFIKRLCCYFALMLASAGILSGCAEQTFTFEPEKTASIFGENHYNNFGVCAGTDRRGTRLYLWDEFVRQRDSTRSDYEIRHLAGYEVAVSRGESCHLRIFETSQSAVRFDLSTLPDGAAVTSAELRIHRHFSPLDPPRLRGAREQCTVILIEQATESWNAGIYRAGLPDGPRPFIASVPARPDAGPHSALGSDTMNLDVSRTVSEWMRGTRANEGFVITPDRDRVMGFYNATNEGGYFCDIGITDFELVVTAAVPD